MPSVYYLSYIYIYSINICFLSLPVFLDTVSTGCFQSGGGTGVVISVHLLILVDIDSFMGGDRDVINRRLGESRIPRLSVFPLSSGLEEIPKLLSREQSLPNSLGFIKGF